MENCCDVFPKFIGKFEWLSITEEKDVTRLSKYYFIN